ALHSGFKETAIRANCSEAFSGGNRDHKKSYRRKKAMNPQSCLDQTKTIERLDLLRADLEKGQHHLGLLDQQRQQVRDTVLRISGAIQVLEELLQAESSPNGEDAAVIPESRGAPAEAAARIST